MLIAKFAAKGHYIRVSRRMVSKWHPRGINIRIGQVCSSGKCSDIVLEPTVSDTDAILKAQALLKDDRDYTQEIYV